MIFKQLGLTDIASNTLSQEYEELLEDIKNRIQQAQARAAIAVNRELVLLCYGIGQNILEKQK